MLLLSEPLSSLDSLLVGREHFLIRKSQLNSLDRNDRGAAGSFES